MKDGDDWCKGSSNAAEGEVIDTFKLIRNDDKNCFQDGDGNDMPSVKPRSSSKME